MKGVLTARQRQVCELLVQGLTDSEIAARLKMAPRTVRWHMEQSADRLGTASTGRVCLAVSFALLHMVHRELAQAESDLTPEKLIGPAG